MTLRYTEDHEWLRLEEDGSVTIGITDHAQEALGDIVYVETPAPGRTLEAGDAACVIESVKAAADINMPFAAEVIATNPEISANPALVNSDPLGAGWFMRVRPRTADALQGCMDEAAYRGFIGR